jgi:soluble lytic murein transglycosylase-like protein
MLGLRADSLVADSLWGSIAADDVWSLRARHRRCDLALQRGGPAAALAALGENVRLEWLPEERAAWRLRRVRLLVAAGDTSGAIALCREGLAVDGATDSASALVPLLESLLAPRGERPTGEDEVEMAAAFAWRDRAAQERHLARAVHLLPVGKARLDASLELATVQRQARRYADARRTLAAARSSAIDSASRSSRLLELARLERTAGRDDEARRVLELAESAAPAGSPRREETRMIAGRWSEEDGLTTQALADYDAAWKMAGERSREAAFRAGLLRWLGGDTERAERRWRESDNEASRFWRAVSLRRRGDAIGGDSILTALASQPGFAHYRSAARETLALGAPRETAIARPGRGDPPPLLDQAEALAALGERADAGYVLDRYAHRESVAPLHAVWPLARNRLRAARLAYALGDDALGIRLAHRSLWATRSSDSIRTAIRPWLYPPSHGALFEARGRVEEVDPALLMAVSWQESYFDTAALSRAGAIGMMQFLPSTAAIVARAMGEPRPGPDDLRRPEVSVRLGAHHLADLLERNDGRVPPTLAAYNAGPGASGRWLRRARGHSDAEFCELISYAETDGYVRSILAVWQAYRTFRPRIAEIPPLR